MSLIFYFGNLGPFQWSHEVEVGKVNASESGSWGGYDNLEEYFDEY